MPSNVIGFFAQVMVVFAQSSKMSSTVMLVVEHVLRHRAVLKQHLCVGGLIGVTRLFQFVLLSSDQYFIAVRFGL